MEAVAAAAPVVVGVVASILVPATASLYRVVAPPPFTRIAHFLVIVFPQFDFYISLWLTTVCTVHQFRYTVSVQIFLVGSFIAQFSSQTSVSS